MGGIGAGRPNVVLPVGRDGTVGPAPSDANASGSAPKLTDGGVSRLGRELPVEATKRNASAESRKNIDRRYRIPTSCRWVSRQAKRRCPGAGCVLGICAATTHWPGQRFEEGAAFGYGEPEGIPMLDSALRSGIRPPGSAIWLFGCAVRCVVEASGSSVNIKPDSRCRGGNAPAIRRRGDQGRSVLEATIMSVRWCGCRVVRRAARSSFPVRRAWFSVSGFRCLWPPTGCAVQHDAGLTCRGGVVGG